jgi:hypothetical protein
MAGAELAAQFLLFDVNAQRLFFAAVDYGWDAAFATQGTGGSLACPFARLGRQGKRIAHLDYLSNTQELHDFTVTPPGMTMTGSARR